MFSSVDPSGKRVKCPKCGERFVAQVMSEPPPPAAEPTEPENPFAGIAEKAGVKQAVEENPFAGIGSSAPNADPFNADANPFEAPTTSASSSRQSSMDSTTMTLKKIHPLQAGKLLAALYLVLGVIITPFLVLSVLMTGDPVAIGGALGIGVGITIGYTLGGFVGGCLGALLYNLVAGKVGGIRVDVE